MSDSIQTRSVADLVLEKPSRSKLFEQLGIDYCCGGKQTLDEACVRACADLQEVLAAIRSLDEHSLDEQADSNGADSNENNSSDGNSSDGAAWQSMSLGELANTIVATHHSFLRKELPRLDELLDRVVAAHGENHPDLHAVRQVFGALMQELMQHMLKEEQVLFPIIHQLEQSKASNAGSFQILCANITNPIRVMEFEHQNAGDGLGKLRNLTGDYTPPEDACPTYHALLDGLKGLELDLHTHIHKENNFLFPKAVALEAAPTD